MTRISFKRYRFPAEVIRHAVWLYFRITLSLRDVEEMLAQRRISVRYEIIRCWVNKFGPQIAKNLRSRKAPPSPRWHLDEMVGNMNGKRVFSGVRSMTRAKSWISSCRSGATPALR